MRRNSGPLDCVVIWGSTSLLPVFMERDCLGKVINAVVFPFAFHSAVQQLFKFSVVMPFAI